MEEEDALDELQCGEDEEIVLAIWGERLAFCAEPRNWSNRDVLLPFPSNRSKHATNRIATIDTSVSTGPPGLRIAFAYHYTRSLLAA